MNTEYESNNLFERARKRDRFWIETAILEFTEEITARMGTLGVNKSELAGRLKVRPAFITKLLSGTNNFTIETMVKTSRALDADLRIHLQPRVPRYPKSTPEPPSRLHCHRTPKTPKNPKT